MNKLLPLILLILAAAAFAQQPDRWRGLIIDETTPEQALKILGEPKTDKPTDHWHLMNNQWFIKNIGKNLRTFHYENIEGFPDVFLKFDAKSKLVVIQLEPKKITAQAFIASYSGVECRFGNEVMSPTDFKQPRDNTDKPQRLAAFYDLIGATDKVIIFGGVGNATGSVMSGMFGGTSARQGGRSTLGDVKIIQMVSRTLENKDGSHLLK